MVRFSLFLLLLTTILVSSCVKEVSQPIEPAVLKKLRLIPADPTNIIYLNFKNLRKTKYWKDFFNPDLSSQSVSKKTIFDSLGINFDKDVDEIIISTEWNDFNSFIITLNRPAREFPIKKKFNDYETVIFDEKIVFISNDHNRIEQIKENVFDNSFTKNPLFRRVINSLQYKEHFWFVTRNTTLLLKLLRNGTDDDKRLENLFRSINFINFSVKLNKDVNINSYWACVDETRANLLRGVLNGIISMIVLTEPNDPLVKELSKSNIFLEGKGVDVQLKIPQSKIELIKNTTIADKLKRLTENER